MNKGKFMDKDAVTKILAVLIVAVIVIAGIGISYWWFMRAKASSIVWGNVSLDEPIVGATISIYDLDGKKIFEEENATGSRGSFIFEVDWGIDQWGGGFPSEFRVVANGGTLNGELFNGTVVSIVHDYTKGDYCVVNEITTLIAAYEDKHPEMSYVETEETIKEFLGVPSNVGIADPIVFNNTLFDHAVFMSEAEDTGGFDAFIDALVDEIEDGETHLSFLVYRAVGGAASWLLKFALEGIANGVLSYMGYTAVGWVFDSILGVDEDTTPGQLEEIQNKLDQMSEQLGEIQIGISHLEQGQQKIIAEIEALAQQIEEEEERTRLMNRRSNIIAAITTPISEIDSTFNQVQRLAKAQLVNATNKTKQAYKDLANLYMDKILATDDIESKLETLHNNIMPFLGELGLLEVWTQLATKGANPYDNITYIYECFENRFAYLLGIEVQGISLVIEAYHGKFGNDTTMAEDFWNLSTGRIKQQIDLFSSCVERMICTRIDTLTPRELNRISCLDKYNPPVIIPMADEFTKEVLSGLVPSEVDSNVTVVALKAIDGKYVGLDAGNVLVANRDSISSNETFEMIDLGNNTVAFKASNGKYVSLDAGNVLVANRNSISSNETFEMIYLGNNTVAFKASNGKYVSLDPDDVLVANRNAIGSSETFEMIHSGNNVAAFKASNGKYVSLDSDDVLVANCDNISSKGIFEMIDLGNNTVALKVWNGKYVSLDSDNSLVAIDPNILVVVDKANNCIQKFDSSGNFILRWGSYGSGNGQFEYPEGIAVDDKGNVYVTDTFNNRIQKFDSDGNFITTWGSKGSGNGQFAWPRGVAVDGNGNVYVVDSHNYRIQKFDSHGDFILKWGSMGTGNGHFLLPYGVAVDSGYIYVADYGNHRIQKFDSNGNFIKKWGSWGSGNGQFEYPEGIAVDSKGNYVYVTDSGTNCIQKFDSHGDFILKWGSKGSGDGQFKDPWGIAVDNHGNVYVVEMDNNRVQKFDSNGNFITKWGSTGFGSGQFLNPEGIAVGSCISQKMIFEMLYLGNNTVAFKANNGKYVGLDTSTVLIANRNAIGSSETFEMMDASPGVLTARIVNYPDFSEKSFDDMTINLQFKNVDTGEVFTANYTERRDGTTISFYEGGKKRSSVNYELLYYSFEAPLGSYMLVNLESEFPGLLRQFDYGQTTMITIDNRYGSRGMTAYLSKVPPQEFQNLRLVP